MKICHVFDPSPDTLATPLAASDTQKPKTIRWERLCWLVALVLGFLQAWGRRHNSADGLGYIGPDGISYLDIGDAYMRGDWYVALNAMWSPFYSWLLGITLHLFKPSPFWEFTVVRLLNFLIYAIALSCFAFFLRALRREFHKRITHVPLPDWSWLVFGYTIFIWTSLFMNRVSRVTPDMLFAALIFLASGILLRMRSDSHHWHLFVSLGVVLGIGYLTKTIMFPLAFVFVGVALVLARQTNGRKEAVLRAAVSLIVFLTLATPFVILLSRSKNRFTIGDSARLNYAWYVNGATRFIHWQGEPVGSGTPLHPTRMLLTAPAIYEFAGPVGATYPPWYDPSYWYEGVALNFNLRQQLSALWRNLASLYGLLLYRGFLVVVGFALFVLLCQTRPWRRVLENISVFLFLLVPSLVAVGFYLLINIEPRYLAPFIPVIVLSLFAAVRLSVTEEAQRLLAAVSVGLVLMFLVSVFPFTAKAAYATLQDFVPEQAASRDVEWQVADGLRKLGVQPGERVATIGNTMFAAWPRLARVRVVAELPEAPPGNIEKFWSGEDQIRELALAAFAQTGARVVVADAIPQWALGKATNWQRIGNTDHYVYFLRR